MIYAIADEITGLIKIGFTTDLERRLIDIRAQYRQAKKPISIVFLGYMEGDWKLEQHLHFTLHASSVLGEMVGMEWYAATDEIIDTVLGMSLDVIIPLECLEPVNYGAILRAYFGDDTKLIKDTCREHKLSLYRLRQALTEDTSQSGKFMCMKLAKVLDIETSNILYKPKNKYSSQQEQAS